MSRSNAYVCQLHCQISVCNKNDFCHINLEHTISEFKTHLARGRTLAINIIMLKFLVPAGSSCLRVIVHLKHRRYFL